MEMTLVKFLQNAKFAQKPGEENTAAAFGKLSRNPHS
jgi:hypothetical protein